MHRDGFGGLLLLPKDFNASFGAAEYEEKLPHYLGQNLLAASLNESVYKKNPSFRQIHQANGPPIQVVSRGVHEVRYR